MQKTQNLQDSFLNQVRKDKLMVTMFLMNGFQLRGIITGYDSCGFTVNDPNSPDNSAKHWTYDRLSPQISNLWFLEAN